MAAAPRATPRGAAARQGEQTMQSLAQRPGTQAPAYHKLIAAPDPAASTPAFMRMAGLRKSFVMGGQNVHALAGVGGIGLGWSAGQILNVLALAYFAGLAVAQPNGPPPPSLAVYTPAWLLLFSLGFATLIGFVSGLYPALRAANLVPVKALKYE
jgi:hypothetical protein